MTLCGGLTRATRDVTWLTQQARTSTPSLHSMLMVESVRPVKRMSFGPGNVGPEVVEAPGNPVYVNNPITSAATKSETKLKDIKVFQSLAKNCR